MFPGGVASTAARAEWARCARAAPGARPACAFGGGLGWGAALTDRRPARGTVAALAVRGRFGRSGASQESRSQGCAPGARVVRHAAAARPESDPAVLLGARVAA